MSRKLLIAFVFACASTSTLGQTAKEVDRYKEFGDKVGKIVQKVNEVAVGRQEQADMRALSFLLRDYNKAVAELDLQEARAIVNRMRVYLVRSAAVAVDAERRKAERERVDAERRHREEMAQRERQHREQMAAQARMLQELRMRQLRAYYGW